MHEFQRISHKMSTLGNRQCPKKKRWRPGARNKLALVPSDDALSFTQPSQSTSTALRTPCAYKQTITTDLVQRPMARSNNRIDGVTATCLKVQTASALYAVRQHRLHFMAFFAAFIAFAFIAFFMAFGAAGAGAAAFFFAMASSQGSGLQECLIAHGRQLGWELEPTQGFSCSPSARTVA